MKKIHFVLMTLLLLAGCGNNKEEKVVNTAVDTTTSKVVNTAMDTAKSKFVALGEMPIPTDNPMTTEKIELGRKLYFDKRLSGDNQLSCADCHIPSAGFGDKRPTFIGFKGFNGVRNSPTVINSGYYKEYFWDGRAASLEEQALGPIQAAGEMNQKLDELIVELNAVPEYVEEFNTVFKDKINKDGIAKAIAAFERTIVIKDTAFDKYLQGDDGAITADAKEGMKLFVGKAGCNSCHSGGNLTNNAYHNTGITGDDGRFNVTKKDEDKGKFRTASLRGLTHTAPYMHNGSLATLKDVVNFYNVGGGSDPNKDSLIKPLNLAEKEVTQLVAFLESMDGKIPEVSLVSQPSNGSEPTAIITCKGCHGDKLQGGSGPVLDTIGALYSKEQINKIIKEGKGQMPGGLIKGEDVDQVTDYLSKKK